VESVLNGNSRYGMSPQVLSSFLRVVTHPRVFAHPSDLIEAIRFCEILLAQPNCFRIAPGQRHWSIFVRLCTDADARGNLVPDAWFAAMAIESGCEWVTLDQDYARFDGLHWRLPS
jgi:toxin-antitoxin system PIN domain toxin